MSTEQIESVSRTCAACGGILPLSDVFLLDGKIYCAADYQRARQARARVTTPVPNQALAIQEGGTHYKELPIQPVEYIHANKIGYFEGNVIKYVTRWKEKGGMEDLKKAKHYIELLLELESKKSEPGQF